MLVAQPAQADEKFRGAGVDPALALDRLDEDRGRLVVHEVGETLEVVQFAKRKAGDQRAEALLDFLLGRGAHAAERAAVKRVLRADDLVAFALFPARLPDPVQPRQLDQRLVRLGAAVAEKHPAGAGVADEAPRKFTLVRIAEKIADVNQLPRLLLHARDPMRVAMAQRTHRDPRRKIQIAVARIVPHLGAAAAHEGQRRTRIVLHHVRVVELGGAGTDDGGSGHKRESERESESRKKPFRVLHAFTFILPFSFTALTRAQFRCRCPCP